MKKLTKKEELEVVKIIVKRTAITIFVIGILTWVGKITSLINEPTYWFALGALATMIIWREIE